MYRTAECVTPKHPDKLCDQISDAILDACLEQDPDTRAAIETMGGHGVIMVMGELTTRAYVDIQKIVHEIVGDPKIGVLVNITKQSPEISQGVDEGGAGDQGICVGYACDENEAMIPQELYLARSLCKHIYQQYPADGKTQITLDDGGKVDTIVASFCGVEKKKILAAISGWVATNIDMLLLSNDMKLYANPAGDWNIGGFDADTGLTGRKIVVDAYGPRIPVGGGAFSGKDATKVDRSGAYMARKAAILALKSFNAKEVYCYVSYAIGKADPVDITAIVDGRKETLDNLMTIAFRPQNIIKNLSLKSPNFRLTAQWGHFGNPIFPWEK